MGLVEFLTGWRYIGNTIKNTIKVNGKYYTDSEKMINHIHKNILRKLKHNVDKDIFHQTKKWLKQNKGHAPLGRTIRGIKNLPNFTGIGYAKGKTFLYKGKETNYYIDNQGHGGAISHGMGVWRKLRTT